MCCESYPADYNGPSCHREIWRCLNDVCFVYAVDPCSGGSIGSPATYWSGRVDQAGDNCPACGQETIEICANDLDDDCDGSLAEDYGTCIIDVPCDGVDDQAIAQCDGTCRFRGGPVDLWTRHMYVGPHEVARVQSDQGGSADLTFELLFDSLRGGLEDDGAMKLDGTEDPHILDVGPGFRHRYADRLIVRKSPTPGQPGVVLWENERGRVHFYWVSAGQWLAEPGTNATLTQSGDTWRLVTPGGDVLEFVDTAAGTSNHPHDVDDQDDHVRLRAILPGASPARRILLLYEDDPTDASAPYDADTIPAPACTDLVPGAIESDCTPSRGLLVKVGVVFGTAAPFEHGPSFELGYTFGGGGAVPQQFLIAEIRNGADRIDGLAQGTYATLGYTSTTPRRLETVTSRIACTSTNDSCTAARYVWDASGDLTNVKRPATDASGTSALLLDEETFSWAGGAVTGHASLGTTLAFAGAGVGQATMQWTKNGAPFDFRFDGKGNPLACSDGSCGDAGEDKQYQRSADFQFAEAQGLFTLGPSVTKNIDGTSTFRRYTERGNVDFECVVVPKSAADAPGCALAGSTVTVTLGVMRRLERRYYDAVAAGAERLRVVAEYDPETANSEVFEFPDAPLAGWQAIEPDLTTCAALDPSFTSSLSNEYTLTVYDYDSDDDGSLDDTGLSTAEAPDLLPVRVNRAASSGGVVARTCTTWQRDDQGRVLTTRSFADGALTSTTTLLYFGVPADQTPSSGRLRTVTRYRDTGTATDPLVVLAECAASDRYDDEGQLACYLLPQPTGPASTVSLSTQAGNGVYARRRTMQVTDGTTTVTSYKNELASGALFESGVGDGVSGGAAEGNRVRRLYDGAGTAAQQLAPGAIEHYDAAGGLVWKSTESHDAWGFAETSKVWQGSSTLRSQVDRIFDEEGRVETSTVKIDATTSAMTSTLYAAPGWDLVVDVVEPDNHHVQYQMGDLFGASADFARTHRVERGGAVQQRLEHARDGAVARVFNWPLSTSTPVAEYSYDPLRRLIKEDRTSAGQVVEYQYADEMRISRRVVKDTLGAIVEDVRYSYDGLGRLLTVAAQGGAQITRLYRYDDKGAFADTWNGVTLSSEHNRGRVAYVEDEDGATFFDYDGAGRVTAIVRYDDQLAFWNPDVTPLARTGFVYGSAGELLTIQYPSGHDVNYVYGNDKERPRSVTSSAFGTVAASVFYEPSGAPRAWRFGGGAGARIVTRDLAGRVTRLVDSYAGSTWSDVSYTYDLDGDLMSETDNSPSHTWLRSITTAPQSRAYDYDTARQKDVLTSWVDNGVPESVVYDDAGRRSTETDGADAFSFAYDPSYLERLLGKTNDAITSREEVLMRYDDAGRVTALDWFADGGGTWDVTYGYGGLGNLETTTTSSGTTTDSYDFEMRLVRIKDPLSNLRRMRYAWGRSPLEETYTTTAGTWRYQNIYLAGEPIAQIAESPTAPAALRLLHTDRMGLPRKIATTGGTRLQRIVFDAWGSSSSIRNDTVTDTVVDPMPSWPWRYPGQRNTGSNGWRQYVAKVGQYTSVDPMHGLSVREGLGPQTFSYASARPFSVVDPAGRLGIDTGSIRGCAGGCASGADLLRKFDNALYRAYRVLRSNAACRGALAAAGVDVDAMVGMFGVPSNVRIRAESDAPYGYALTNRERDALTGCQRGNGPGLGATTGGHFNAQTNEATLCCAPLRAGATDCVARSIVHELAHGAGLPGGKDDPTHLRIDDTIAASCSLGGGGTCPR